METQAILPLFFDADALGFRRNQVKSKQYLAQKNIGKGASAKRGYVPDFCIYENSLPILVIEAKSPENNPLEAAKEAALYCHEINKGFGSGINPCQLIFSTNGDHYFAGYWDAEPVLDGLMADLQPGSRALATLKDLLGPHIVQSIAEGVAQRLRAHRFKRPAAIGAGPAMMNSKIEPNTFAADLAPTLRRYFSSRDQNDDPEIYDKAYISSDEVTSYDRILESFLKDRTVRLRTQEEIQTTRKGAGNVTSLLRGYRGRKNASGELQLITGGVGAGKSLFARRYKQLLMPRDLRSKSHWSFIDFNEAVDLTRDAKDWVALRFVESLLKEGSSINLRDEKDQERVFATDLADRKSYYARLDRLGEGRGELERIRDLEMWRQEPIRAAKGCARYLQGDKAETVIVVFDNVDRRDSDEQLAAFQLALWFMAETRSLVLLQMRDATFEAYKNEPPLDTYKTGQIFHVSAPRFVDVVRRRLELSLVAFEGLSSGTVEYKTSKGITVSYPRERAGAYLREVYEEVFLKPKNIATILESLAGKDVRKSLDMFMAIITSGHMPEEMIAAVSRGEASRGVPEYVLLRVLMRQDYRFFNDSAGFIHNIFWTNTSFQRPSNFMLPEILFFLIANRKAKGENGLTGYVALSTVMHRLEHMGYVVDDVREAIVHLLERGLIESDTFSIKDIVDDMSIKATASGWAHMRILSSRTEYVASALPVTPIADDGLVAKTAGALNDESRFGRLSIQRQNNLVAEFLRYLRAEFTRHLAHPGYAALQNTGAAYIIDKIESSLAFDPGSGAPGSVQLDLLDT